MLQLRARYPQVRLIFLRRDVPNTLWSIYKRGGYWSPKTLEFGLLNQTLLTDEMKEWASKERSKLCNIRTAWEQRPRTTLDFTVDLHNFTEHTNATLADILGPTRRRRQPIPASTGHTASRSPTTASAATQPRPPPPHASAKRARGVATLLAVEISQRHAVGWARRRSSRSDALPTGNLTKTQTRLTSNGVFQIPVCQEAHHCTRRKWQATHPVYRDDSDLFRKEAPQAVSDWLATLSCTH